MLFSDKSSKKRKKGRASHWWPCAEFELYGLRMLRSKWSRIFAYNSFRNWKKRKQIDEPKRLDPWNRKTNQNVLYRVHFSHCEWLQRFLLFWLHAPLSATCKNEETTTLNETNKKIKLSFGCANSDVKKSHHHSKECKHSSWSPSLQLRVSAFV